jgi:hypothetical protein
MGVEAAFALVYHPQFNGAAEKANTLVFSAIKKIFEDQQKGKWAKELLRAMWSHTTVIYRMTKFHPFQATVQRGTYNPRRNQASQCQNKGRGHKQPNKSQI